MKSLMRWGAMLGLMGSVLLGPSLTGNTRALALPEEQIMQKLQTVPVFTVTDGQGAPVVASVNDGNNSATIAHFFISPEDARAYVERVRTQNPALAQTAQITPVSLAEVYEQAQQNQNNTQNLKFALIPQRAEVDLALGVLRADGQQVQEFDGVPLFLATGGPDNGYLSIEIGNEEMIPLFFTKEQLQGMISQFQQQNPDLAATAEIQVVNLQAVIQLMQESNDPQINKIVLIPPRESIEFLRSLQPASGQNPAGQPPVQPRR